MTLRAKGARKRRGSSPRRKEEGTVKVCPEAGRERRLMYGHLGAPARAAVNRERRAPAAGSRAFIKDAGRRFAAIPHIRPGHADLAARGTCPADPRRAPTSREGSAQGKPGKQALVVVAVKLLHAVYAMLKHRQPYNPSRLLVAPATIGS